MSNNLPVPREERSVVPKSSPEIADKYCSSIQSPIANKASIVREMMRIVVIKAFDWLTSRSHNEISIDKEVLDHPTSYSNTHDNMIVNQKVGCGANFDSEGTISSFRKGEQRRAKRINSGGIKSRRRRKRMINR